MDLSSELLLNKQITHKHTKQLVRDLQSTKNPKQVLTRNAFERRIVYEYCESYGWQRTPISKEQRTIDVGRICDGSCGDRGCDAWISEHVIDTEYTTFKLTYKPSWTKKQVRQPLRDVGISDDVIVNAIYPYVPDL